MTLAAGRRPVGPLPSKPGEVRRLWHSQLPSCLGLAVFHGVLKTGLPLCSPPGQTDWYLEESACTKLTLSLASSGWLFFLRNKKVTHVWRSSDYWLPEDCLVSWGVVELGRHLLKVLHLANVSLSLLSVFV